MDDLVIVELFSANWTEFLGHFAEAFVAGSMTAVKNAFFALLEVVSLEADLAGRLRNFRGRIFGDFLKKYWCS